MIKFNLFYSNFKETVSGSLFMKSVSFSIHYLAIEDNIFWTLGGISKFLNQRLSMTHCFGFYVVVSM